MPCCRSIINCIPVLFVLILLSWSYYSYVIQLCIYTINHDTKKFIYIVIFHIIYLLVMWSYFSVMCTEHNSIPIEYRIPIVYYERLKLSSTEEASNAILEAFCEERRLKIYTVTSTGSIRYCQKCKQVKPDRTHHCSTCKTCVPKMDHHCPWVNNCIGFSNYKLFVIFLLYASFLCWFIGGSSLEYFIAFLLKEPKEREQYNIVVLFLISVAFGILILSLFAYHMSLILKNSTTLEELREIIFKSSQWTFDLGTYNNFVEVFGENGWLWFLPIYTSLGDGFNFPVEFNF